MNRLAVTFIVIIQACAGLLLLSSSGAVAAAVGLSPRAAVELRTPFNYGDPLEKGGVFVSPSRSRFLVVLTKADVRLNGIWVDFVSGETNSTAALAHLKTVRLFTTGKFGTNASDRNGQSPTYPSYVNKPRWLDDDTIALLWRSDAEPQHLISINLKTGTVKTLVKNRTQITDFGVSGDKTRILYISPPLFDRVATVELERRGYPLRDPGDFSDYITGDLKNKSQWSEMSYYVRDMRHRTTKQVRVPDGSPAAILPEISMQPAGRYSVVMRQPVASPPEVWDRYTSPGFAAELKGRRRLIEAARAAGSEVQLSRQMLFLTFQPLLIDLVSGTARPLIDAPLSNEGDRQEVKVIWSPDGKYAAIGPAFLPLSSPDPVGLAGRAVAAIDLQSGAVSVLPITNGLIGPAYHPFAWTTEGEIRVTNGRGFQCFRKSGRQWILTSCAASAVATHTGATNDWTVGWQEDLNTPPRLIATSRSTRSTQVLLEPEPDLLNRFKFGRVERIEWTNAAGHTYTGVLTYPVGYQAGQRYPLVVQTHGEYLAPGRDEDFFTVFGNVVGQTGSFASQPLANRGIMVLQMIEQGIDLERPGEIDAVINQYESGIAALVGKGMVDPNRVGIAGFSRSTWYVLQSLTHGDFVYRAAFEAEGGDESYLSTVLQNDDVGSSNVQSIGSDPYGQGLIPWLEKAPGFNVERIRTPVLIEAGHGPIGALQFWEVFARMRHLGLPVEYFELPDGEYANHPVQMSSQRLSYTEMLVDWMDYWLNDSEKSPSITADQLKRWQAYRIQRDQALGMPRPPLLKWTAQPVSLQ